MSMNAHWTSMIVIQMQTVQIGKVLTTVLVMMDTKGMDLTAKVNIWIYLQSP